MTTRNTPGALSRSPSPYRLAGVDEAPVVEPDESSAAAPSLHVVEQQHFPGAQYRVGMATLAVHPALRMGGPSPLATTAAPLQLLQAGTSGDDVVTRLAPRRRSRGDLTNATPQRPDETPISARDDAMELDTTPIVSRSSKDESDAAARSCSTASRSISVHSALHRSLASVRGAHAYSVITFDLKCHCPPGEEYLVVKRVKGSMRRVAPRCRLQAYKERCSHDDETLFDGVVQVVPMFSMLQVSVERVVDTLWLMRLTSGAAFWCFGIVVNLLLFLLLLVQQHVPSQQSTFAPLNIAVCAACGATVLAAVMVVCSWSKQLAWLVLKSFDFWMLQFWVVVTITCNVTYVHQRFPSATRAMSVCEGIGLVISLECVLCLDAFPPLPRAWKGVLYLTMAAFNAYRYLHWFVSVRTDAEMTNASIDFGRFELHLATAGQSAGAALVAFYCRLGMRALWKKLDLQLLDFPMQMVPHIDEEEQRRAEVAAARGSLARRQASLLSSPSNHLKQPSSQHSTCGNTTAVGGDESAALLPPSSPLRAARQQDPPCDVDVYASCNSGTFRQPSRASSRHPSKSSWLHVQGSLPCQPSRVAATCEQLQMEVAEIGGKIALAVVEESNVFDCDRRTFEPSCFMLSFSPKPLISIPIVFRGLSTKAWTRLAMTCVMLGSVVMFLVNEYSHENYILMSAVQSFLLGIAVIELLCGVSVDVVRHMFFTLDFWYVLVVFLSQIFSGVVIYSSSYNVALAVLHTCMVASTSMFVATMDAIVLTTFDGIVKGTIASTLAVYCLLDLVWVTPAAIRAKPETYNKSMDLYVSVLSPGSIAIIADVACFLVFLRVAGRTLWMRSRLVFLQFGAKEEVVTETDAALMASGGFSGSLAAYQQEGKNGDAKGVASSAASSNMHRQDSASNMVSSRLSFFASYLGDEGPHAASRPGGSTSNWRASMKANRNAKFVHITPKQRQPGANVDDSAATVVSVDDATESDSSAVRF